MARRRLRYGVTVLTTLAVFVLSVPLGFAVNAASGLRRWPGGLDVVRRHPFWSVAVLVAASVVVLAVAAWSERGRRGVAAAADVECVESQGAPDPRDAVSLVGVDSQPRVDSTPSGVQTNRLPLPMVRDVRDPSLVGIHPAIASRRSLPSGSSTDLPAYVGRDIDGQVRDAVAAAAANGAFVVLVGAAATGKTRCAYEAVRAVLPQWRMLIPEPAGELTAWASCGQVARTVVWLDDLEAFLRPEGLTASIVRQLRVDAEQPVLLIGTMWPDTYEQLHVRRDTSAATPDEHDSGVTPAGAPGISDRRIWPIDRQRQHQDPGLRQRQLSDDAHRVLRLATHRIWLSQQFSPDEWSRAEQVAALDRRVAEALTYRTSLGLPAVLAAAPELIRRLGQPQPSMGREVLSAAVAARACGHPDPVPAQLLKGLTESVFLTGAQRAQAVHGWFAAAVASASRPVRSVVAPMWATASRAGQRDGYAVSDILIQHHRENRSEPESTVNATWMYLAEHAQTDACYAVSISAYRAHREQATRMATQRAAESGHTKAMNNFAVILEEAGDLDRAAIWYARAAESGFTKAMYNLAMLAGQRGDLPTASMWYLRAADQGHAEAMFMLGYLANQAGDLVTAWSRYQQAIEAGSEDAANNIGVLLDEQGNVEQAKHWYRRAADAGDTRAMLNMGTLLHTLGDRDGAGEWWTKAAEAGEPKAMFNLGNDLVKHGDREVGLWWLTRAAEAGNAAAANNLAVDLDRCGEQALARTWFERAAEAGDTKAMTNLGNLLQELGNPDAATPWYQRAVDLGEHGAEYPLSHLLAAAGDLQPVRAWFQHHTDAGSVWAVPLAHVLALHHDLDTVREAFTAASLTAADGIATHLAQVLVSFGDTETVQSRFQQAADTGDAKPLMVAAILLVTSGHSDVPQAWFQHAVASNNHILIVVLGPLLGADSTTVENAIQALAARGDHETIEQLRQAKEALATARGQETST